MGEGHTRADRPSPGQQPTRRLTVAKAAEVLGISEDAIRSRLKRGTLQSERVEGRVYILLGRSERTDRADDRPSATNALTYQMQARIDSLERSLEAEREANRENRRIIGALTARVPELEAPQEASEDAETVEETPDRAEPRPATGGAQEGAQRPWWRRVFGR